MPCLHAPTSGGAQHPRLQTLSLPAHTGATDCYTVSAAPSQRRACWIWECVRVA